MWKCPSDLEHITCYVFTGDNPNGGYGGFKNKHIIWCYTCLIPLAVDDESGETVIEETDDGQMWGPIPQPAQPTMNLLAPPKGGIPIKSEGFSFNFFQKRFKSRD